MRDKETYWNEIHFFNNFLLKLLHYNRKKIFEIFVRETKYSDKSSLLDIGTTPSTNKAHNILLQQTANNKNITCLSNLDCKSLKSKFPNVKKYIKTDGKKTNLKENNYDIVHSSATIEHVGKFSNQILLVKECLKLSKKYVFITTPNRYYPLDFHTKIPIIHWLPKKIHRNILRFVGLNFYSLEKNLNLLDKKSLIAICQKLNIKNFTIIKFKFLFITSNLILIIKKS
jgi:2-polyprenyl-3-methyl-5-hydroxy-6-metoxy-1,4-benzoquinol methylase